MPAAEPQQPVREPGRLERLGRVVDDARRAVDDARRAADTARQAVLTPVGVRGTAVETAWWVAHLAMWPFGHGERRVEDVVHRTRVHDQPPVHRALLVGDVEAAGTPILLVHGIVDNRTIFTMLRRGLRRRGFGRVVAVNYSSLGGDVRVLAARLGEVVEELCEETGFERVHVVGHSLGGLIARYYIQRLGGDERVHTLVTLGTPHGGTVPAYTLPSTLVRQLRPGSDIVRELDEPAPGCRTRIVAVWSDLDQLVMPQRNGRVVHPDLQARNVFVRGVGHLSLPVDGRVVHEICTTLAHLDHDGHTVAAGATSIASSTGRTPAGSVTPPGEEVARGRSGG